MTRASGRMRPQTPGGEGRLLTAERIYSGAPLPGAPRIRLNPGGGEYEAVLFATERQPGHPTLIRLYHWRPELERTTINVVPASTEVRILE